MVSDPIHPWRVLDAPMALVMFVLAAGLRRGQGVLIWRSGNSSLFALSLSQGRIEPGFDRLGPNGIDRPG